ncbi:Potassium channel [Aspergillus nanangensis]|uniref:Potassium channel n=1 Tax=Aspergillus nanangensis TaxID=2582783 RepID=A0AAD4GMR9_ASPNN|nr:Potassium channel [Aspergillus nanangensis]
MSPPSTLERPDSRTHQSYIVRASKTGKLGLQFNPRPPDDDEPQDWWFASTAIPLIAATTAPFANVMSIVALAMPWKSRISPGQVDVTLDSQEVLLPDPSWCLGLNATSLACGIAGNIFLLFNFTRVVRYIIALPVSIVLWALSMGILTGITISIDKYDPPAAPNEIYTQAYWYAVIAAAQYFFLTTILIINITGYLLGHYPQYFALSDHQRTLILQTTALGVWLVIGAAVFQRVIGISFAEALYFSDVTILTLGFGDVTAKTSVARGLVFPYSVMGIVILGLVIGSINKFFREIQDANVVRKHIEKRRRATITRANTLEKRSEETTNGNQPNDNDHLSHQATHITYRPRYSRKHPIISTVSALYRTSIGRPKLGDMTDEKARFEAMRAIQNETVYFRRWYRLILSVLAYGILWTCGAAVFWSLEDGLTYFDALYFAFCSLVTIGYGDITPSTNVSKPFFVVWSLLAIPTMTTLITEMSNTIVAGFKRATSLLADWTVLPKRGQYRGMLGRIPLVMRLLEHRAEKRRLQEGFDVGVEPDAERGEEGSVSASLSSSSAASRSRSGHDDDDDPSPPSPDGSARELAQQLAFAITRTAKDVTTGRAKQYSYEEWADFTRMIRITDPTPDGVMLWEDEYGVLNWDWIGEKSPMMAAQTESEWVLDRLCESLVRHVSNYSRERNPRDEDNPTLKKEAAVKF